MIEAWYIVPPHVSMDIAPTARIYSNVKFADSVQRLDMADNSFLGDFTFVSVPSLILLEGAQVNSGCRLTGRGPILIGKDAVVGYGCTLLTSTDTPESYYMNDARAEAARLVKTGGIDIGNRAFVGSHSILAPGVSLAEGVVVQALSYVDQNLKEPDTIYGGRPARLIGHRRIQVGKPLSLEEAPHPESFG